MESEPDEAPRPMVLPTLQKQSTLHLPTLEAMISKYQATMDPIAEEPKLIYSKVYQVGANERQPLNIYQHDSNWHEVVETFVRYHELSTKQRAQILVDVAKVLK